MKLTKQLVRFDWAIKKLLRNKTNFDILEGFLSELLNENIVIKQILESESNKETQTDKHNRVDLLVENSTGELIIIEIQNSKEYDYFHRILYGTSKAISEHITEGKAYSFVKKVISITIAYFDLGQGKDYLYHGTNEFRGVHFNDVLSLAKKQKELYDKEQVYEIFPEYWLIKVSQFNDAVQSKLDEWIYFLKNGEIEKNFTAKGILAAREKLNKLQLSEEDRLEYKYYLKRLHDIASEEYNKMIDIDIFKKGIAKGMEAGMEAGIEKGIAKGIEKGIAKGIEKGIEKAMINSVIGLHQNGISVALIATSLNITEQKVELIIKNTKE